MEPLNAVHVEISDVAEKVIVSVNERKNKCTNEMKINTTLQMSCAYVCTWTFQDVDELCTLYFCHTNVQTTL